MSKFALQNIDAVQGTQRFEKLLVDGVAPFDTFEESLEEAEKKNLAKIYAYMNDVANNKLLPKTKFRNVTPKKEKVSEFEFKEGNLRVYAISTSGGKIIIMGGMKNHQKKDFVSFRSLKHQYLNQITTKYLKNEKGRSPKK